MKSVYVKTAAVKQLVKESGRRSNESFMTELDSVVKNLIVKSTKDDGSDKTTLDADVLKRAVATPDETADTDAGTQDEGGEAR